MAPARRRPTAASSSAAAATRTDFPWTDNIYFVRHLPPGEHPAFYSSSRLTLNVTRGAMAAMGYCPSGRLFEAAACGTAILSDSWHGLDAFFEPGREILLAQRPRRACSRRSQLSDAELRAHRLPRRASGRWPSTRRRTARASWCGCWKRCRGPILATAGG